MSEVVYGLTEHPTKSVSTRNGHQSKQATRVNSGFDTRSEERRVGKECIFVKYAISN